MAAASHAGIRGVLMTVFRKLGGSRNEVIGDILMIYISIRVIYLRRRIEIRSKSILSET